MSGNAAKSWKNVAFRVPADKHAEIKARAQADGMPMCSYVRRLVYRDLRGAAATDGSFTTTGAQ